MLTRRRLRGLLLAQCALSALLLLACQTVAPAAPSPAPGTPAAQPAGAPPSAAQATTTAAVATAQAQARRAGPRQRLWVMTSGTGSAEELYGRGIAQSISDRFDGYEGSAEVSTGPAMDLTFLARRQADLALVPADAAADALGGGAETPALPVRALATLYPNYLHLVTLADSQLQALADLRGRPVALGPPGSATEFLARRVLAASELSSPSAIDARALGPAEAITALRERAVAAFFWLGPLPVEMIKAAARPGPALRLVPLGPTAAALSARYPGIYRAAEIPAGTYADQSQPVSTIAVDTLLVASQTLDEKIAYGVLRATFDNLRELPFFHPQARTLTLLTAAQTTPVPFHPGAARFYREKGVLA